MKKGTFALWFVTIYLVAYAIVAYLEVSLGLTLLLFSLSPFLVVWMVLSVLTSKIKPSTSLKEGEEWGYEDKNKDELGIF